jgi:MFS family permease
VSRHPVRLGLRANATQFWLLVGLNAVVGATIGLERTVLPLVGEQDFGLTSKSAILSFIVAFGAAKALANLASGPFADRAGRKRVLVAGWALALPAPVLIALAENWGTVVAANASLGASQGFAWSMTVLMKIDLVGPRRRGLALGLNESAGYLGLALTATLTGALAGSIAPRTLVWSGASALAGLGLAATLAFVRETKSHARTEQEQAAPPAARRPAGVLAACAQAGFVNNANDALAWGLLPVYLAANGASPEQIGIVAGVYPAVWGAGQLGTGALSDFVGRGPPITGGMLLQGLALAVLLLGGGAFAPSLAGAALLGLGTALVYPTLIAAVSDAVAPRDRARSVGAYRFWRDAGLVAGALVAGAASDAFGSGTAIGIVGAATTLSGLAFLGATVQSNGHLTGRRETWQLT